MSFKAFDAKNDEYEARAKAAWGDTPAYREFEKKSAGRGIEEEQALGAALMEIFREFAAVKDRGPASKEARVLVEKLQAYITENYYTCTDEILESLGQMYAGGGEMTDNIDKHAGTGTAVFAGEAIEHYLLPD